MNVEEKKEQMYNQMQSITRALQRTRLSALLRVRFSSDCISVVLIHLWKFLRLNFVVALH